MTPRERLLALEQFGIKLGLHNITTLLDALHDPHEAFATVHVAGTNGKGSVTAMVERGLRAAGVTTGRYTSPHLDRIEERVAINGAPVDAALFDAAAADVLAAIDRLREDGSLETMPTFFEATTALAFEVFRRHSVNVAVVEVGLGGRFDATNVIVPIVAVITSIALDHERYLGDTLAKIAFEKAGVIKHGVPVVCGTLPDEAMAVVARVAAAKAALVIEATPTLESGGVPVQLSLNGVHQRQNAAVAVATLEVCRARGFPVDDADVITALSDVEWPARLEWLRTQAGDLLIDAAHNPAGAKALADYVLTEQLGAVPVVLAVMKDKDVRLIVRELAPVASRFIATQVVSARALDAGSLADEIKAVAPNVQVGATEDPDAAVQVALADSDRAIAAGSIFLVGPLRARLIGQGAVSVRYPSSTPFFLH